MESRKEAYTKVLRKSFLLNFQRKEKEKESDMKTKIWKKKPFHPNILFPILPSTSITTRFQIVISDILFPVQAIKNKYKTTTCSYSTWAHNKCLTFTTVRIFFYRREKKKKKKERGNEILTALVMFSKVEACLQTSNLE